MRATEGGSEGGRERLIFKKDTGLIKFHLNFHNQQQNEIIYT